MIKITNLNKYFYYKKSNQIHVVNNTSITFPQTGLVTILGESGCGKTTLLNILGGLDDFRSGTIEYDGIEVELHNITIQEQIYGAPEELGILLGMDFFEGKDWELDFSAGVLRFKK